MLKSFGCWWINHLFYRLNFELQIRKQEFADGEKEIFDIDVRISGAIYSWTMNSTTQRNIASAHGMDTAKWKGKKIKFSLVKQNVFGKMKDVIYAEPAETAGA